MSAIMRSVEFAAVLAGFCAFGIAPASADEAQYIIKPLHGITVHAGSKHAIGYFEADTGVCQLTLVVGEEPVGDEVLNVMPTRFRASIKAGDHVRFDTGDGKEVAFYCGPGATAMAMQTMQQTAYSPVHIR